MIRILKNSSLANQLSIVVTILVMAVAIQSCSRKIAFATSSVVPAAEGSVKVKKDKNDNYNIDLEIMRLADPKRLDPSKKVYVVWMNTERNGTQNIGQLTTSSGFLSSTLKSSLKTVTPYKPVKIFITAEDNADILYAWGKKVLETTSF